MNLEKFKAYLLPIRRAVKGLWSEEGSVAQKAARGAVWLLAGSGIGNGLQLLQTLILVRLLQPSDFGLMRLVMVTVAISTCLSNLGIPAAVIQRKEIDEGTLNTAWTVESARLILVAVIIFAAAGPVAIFYSAPLLKPMIQVVSIKLALTSFRNIGIFLMDRELLFRRKQIFEACLSVAATCTIVIAGIYLRNAWAFVIGQLVYGVGELVGSYIIHPFRPKYRLNMSEARELLRFGKYVGLSSIFAALRNTLDSILLGKWLGVELLGSYTLARSLVELPTQVIMRIIPGVMFPTFARLQNSWENVRRAFLHTLAIATLLLFPVLVGMAATAKPLVHVMYTSRYAAIASIVVGFCLVNALSCIATIAQNVLLSQGYAKLNLIIDVVSATCWGATMWLLANPYGMVGAVLSMGIAVVVQFVIAISLLKSLGAFPLSDLLTTVARPLMAAVIMGFCVWFIGGYLSLPATLNLAIMIVSGVLFYVAGSLVLNRKGVAYARKIVGSVGA